MPETNTEPAASATHLLFSGTPEPFGALSNERLLAKVCPREFVKTNPWSTYAMKLFFNGGSIKDWTWRTDDAAVRMKQRACFYGLLGSYVIQHEDKEAVAGWMLSEMLTECPKW